jgi:hypothetical protein
MKMKFKTIRTVWCKTKWILAIQATGVALSTLSSGCASTGYVADRMRDAGDVFSAAVGVGTGAKVRVGPIQAALLADLPKAGMRGGQISAYGKNDEFLPATHDYQLVCFGSEGFIPESNMRHKAFQANSTFPFFHTLHPQYRASVSYYTQLEVVVALGGSLRLGFNPGELLDFILGWTTLDIFNDDLNRKEANHAMHRTK